MTRASPAVRALPQSLLVAAPGARRALFDGLARLGAWRPGRHRREAAAYLDIAGAMLLGMDRDGVVRMANRRLCEVLGQRETDLIGHRYVDVIVAEQERDAAEASLERLIASGADRVRVERLVRAANGQDRLVEWDIAIRRDHRRRPVGALASGEDVTDRRRTEAQIARDQRDLAGLRRLSQDVASRDDARPAVLDRVVELAEADVALLIEPAPDGTVLDTTTATVPGLLGYRIPMDGDRPSGARECFMTGRSGFHAALPGAPPINPHVEGLTGAKAFAFEPVVVAGAVAAVLCVGWRNHAPVLGSRERDMVVLAANEAAVALQRLSALRRLEDAALSDSLTGVANRRAFDRQLPLELAHARRSGRPLALAMMDLNDFKALNDREGHEAGDHLLRACADAWAIGLRGSDLLARLGGDEFAILLPECEPWAAERVAARLRQAVPHAPGCGVGVVVWDGAEDGERLLARADRALYEDKARGAAARLAAPRRLAALRATGMLDGAGSPELDDVAAVVRWLLGVPVALVSLVGDDRQLIAAHNGLTDPLAEAGHLPLTHSFCPYPVATGRPLVIDDARASALGTGHPAVDELGVRAYLGVPLTGAEGDVLGAVCAIDHQPRRWTADDIAALRRLAERAAAEVAARTTDATVG